MVVDFLKMPDCLTANRAITPPLSRALLPLDFARCASVILLVVFAAQQVAAQDLTSPSYRHRAGSVSSASAVGAGGLTSSAPSPSFLSNESVVGTVPSSPSGSATDLQTVFAGFLAIVAGALPSLDIDGDLVQFFLDPDDDGDGILDVHETGTGIFVSVTNTGTSPALADSDGDGYSDGVELSAGSDPNNPGSTPAPPQVPVLSPTALITLVILLTIAAIATSRSARPRRRRIS